MVCNRCKMVVKSSLEKLGLHPLNVNLGIVELQEKDIAHIKSQLITELKNYGFDLLDNKKSQTIEQIKTLIIDVVQNKNNDINITLSELLATKLYTEYSTLSHLFSEVEGITIERYYILQKIEKVKELLMYDELSLSEISNQLNYSSVAYLSNQFKKETGLTPSHFKKLGVLKRKSLEDL